MITNGFRENWHFGFGSLVWAPLLSGRFRFRSLISGDGLRS
jgi:cation transport regulator ChaC